MYIGGAKCRSRNVCGGDSQFKKMIKTPKNNHQILPTQWLLIMKTYKGTFLCELESRNQNNVQTK